MKRRKIIVRLFVFLTTGSMIWIHYNKKSDPDLQEITSSSATLLETLRNTEHCCAQCKFAHWGNKRKPTHNFYCHPHKFQIVYTYSRIRPGRSCYSCIRKRFRRRRIRRRGGRPPQRTAGGAAATLGSPSPSLQYNKNLLIDIINICFQSGIRAQRKALSGSAIAWFFVA